MTKPRTTVILAALALASCRTPETPSSPNRNRQMTTIPGYAYGSSQLPHSPVTLAELELLEQSVLLTDDDLTALRMSRPVLEPQVEAILDVWYGFVGSTPHLLKYFENVPRGVPDGDYLAAVRKRFGRWILDTASGNYDQSWLDYQHEIGLRHHTTKKNRTDNVQSQPIIHFRYLAALVYPITATLKPFLAKGGHDAAQVDRMHQAWIKSVLLQVILWSYPYVRDGEF